MKSLVQRVLILLIALIFSSTASNAQTCCSGGVPMSSNIGLPATEQGNWQFSLNYDFNSLKTLKDGQTELSDQTRERNTHSALFEVGYSFSNKFSADLFLSFVGQERIIRPVGLPTNKESTNGIGDAVILLKYRLYPNLNVGLGIKAPLGASDLLNAQGFQLVADLQPGSGAWDQILWFNYAQNLTARPNATLSTTLIARLTGENDDYLGVQIYEFGNEVQFIASYAERLTIGKALLDPSFSLRYRKAGADQVDGRKFPNTGGSWIFANPGMGFVISPNLNFQANVEVPVFSKVVGTQLTPTLRANTGFFFRLVPKKTHFE